MKKLIVLLLSALVMSCSMMYHNADDIINDMRDARHAQYFNVGTSLLGIGKILSPTLSEASLGITSVQVLDLSRCSGNVREKFRKRLLNLDRYYEPIVTSQSGHETRTALIRRDGQYVSEIVLANASDMSDLMVLIYGHINLENLERIVNDQRNYLIK